VIAAGRRALDRASDSWGRHRVLREFGRYLLTGSAAFASDFLLLVGLTEGAGLNYLVANLFAFAAGFLVNYLLCVRWVFERRRFAVTSQEFAVFVAVALPGLALNEAVLWLAVALAGLHYAAAKVLATGLVFVVNFLLRKFLLFR
jgi:putative flippase GtrA